VEKRDSFSIGLEGVRPIIDAPEPLHVALKRTQVDLAGTLTNEQLAERLSREPRVLCVVNTRRHAADIYGLLDATNALHLSASMCAQHRAAVLRLVRCRLSRGLPCKVISTQVIEAGVDVDFPAVYRAAAGLDSVAQAAGRCNREGLLVGEDGRPGLGRVVVFDYDELTYRPPQFVRHATRDFREIAPDHESDLLSPGAVEAYFRLHYWQQGGEDGAGWDQGRGGKSVMACHGGGSGDPLHHQFREAAERYQLIDDAQIPVLVPYRARGRELIGQLASMPDLPDPRQLRRFDRAAQRYIVPVREHALRQLLENQVLLERHGRYYLHNPKGYDRKVGLTLEATGLDPGQLILD